jgi:hypothetical protein
MLGKIQGGIAKIGIGLGLALLACSSIAAQDISTNAMPGTDFSKYHTYKWIEIKSPQHPNQIVDAQIKQSIDAQLATKGLTKTDSDTADLYIGYQAAISQSTQWNAYGTGGGWRFGGGMGTVTSSAIDTGTLVVDMYDVSNKQLVWSGRATKTINPNNSQEKKQKNLDAAMKKLFQKYPPK